VWMVTAGREKGEQEWVVAAVYRTEETNEGTALRMREVDGRHEEFRVVVPHHKNRSPHAQQVHEGFRFVANGPVTRDGGNTHDEQLRLFDLPYEIECEVIFPLVGADGLGRLRRTCTLGIQRISEATLTSVIDRQIAAKRMQDLVSYHPNSWESTLSLDLLQKILYIIQHGGEWSRWTPILRVAEQHGRVFWGLPIPLREKDFEGVGSRALFDGRCEPLRQFSLLWRHLQGDTTLHMTLQRMLGEEWLDGYRLTIRTLQTLPADSSFRARFDETDPVCQLGGNDYDSVRAAVLYK